MFSPRYSPYRIVGGKSKRKKKSRKESVNKIKMKSPGINTIQQCRTTYSKFLFLDDIFTMSANDFSEVARNVGGYILKLSDSQDTPEVDGENKVQSRLKVSKVPGTNWIKYS